MKDYLKKANILDLDENMSISNIAVIISLLVVCVFPSFPMAIVFLVSTLNYSHKRFETARFYYEEKKFTDHNMVMMQNQMDKITRDHENIIKIAEDAKKLVSERNLAKGFTGRGARQ